MDDQSATRIQTPAGPTKGATPARDQLMAPLISGLALVIGTTLIIRSTRTMGRKRAARENAALAEIRSKLSEPAYGAPKAGAVAQDIEELAERLAAKLDAKAARLERLLAQADARLAALGQAVEQPGPSASMRVPTGRPTSNVRLVSENDETPAAHRRVYELADQGLASREIAQRLSQPVGQVELVLALRRSRAAL